MKSPIMDCLMTYDMNDINDIKHITEQQLDGSKM
jgi:hypothetical protein